MNQDAGPHQTLIYRPLILNQPPELWEINVCCLSHPVHGIFVTAAPWAETTPYSNTALMEDQIGCVLLGLAAHFSSFLSPG